MNYNLEDVEFVHAVQLSGFKADVQVQVTIKTKDAIDAQNLQVKLISNKKGFNQIDKRWIDKYAEMWSMPLNIVELLKLYTGESRHNRLKTKDNRILFATEFTET